jgi:portal protein
MKPADAQTHATALKRFKFVSAADADLRTLELDDQRFCAGNADNGWQWPEHVRTERAGMPGQVPARPCLTINKVAAPVAQIANTAREARFSITVTPKGAKATRETADVFQGLIRNAEVQSDAQIARIWGFDRALKCGRGYWRVLTKYVDDGDSDLDIVTERILNQASVYLDPAAQQPDWSDGDWAFITVWLTKDKFTREYPDAEIPSDDAFSGLGDTAPDWLRGDGDEQEIRIAEYFYAVYTEIPTVDLQDGRSVPLSDPAAQSAVPVIRSRTITSRSIKWCKLTAAGLLDQQDWPGKYIPIVPVLGDEWNIDGTRIFQGIVRPAKDAQRSYNYMRSAQVEAIGLAPRAPFVGAEGQFEGHPEWDSANTRNYSKLEYVPTDLNGNLNPPPQRNVVEPAVQAITLAAHEADGDIHATTGVPPVALGALDPHDRSGKAIRALQQQSDQGSSNYLDNLKRAVAFEGRIYVDLIPKVYTRPGRVAQLLGTDDEASSVLLGAPFVKTPAGPQAAPPEHPEAQTIDLTAGQYTIAVTVGKSFTNQRQEAVAMMGDLANAAPQMVPSFADLWVDEMDFPGAHAIAERLKKLLPPPLQDSPEGQNVPPQIQQHLAQMQGQLQQATQIIQQLQQQIATDQAKQQGAIEKAKIDQAGAIEIQRMRDATSIAVAQISASTKVGLMQSEAANEATALHQQQQHAVGMTGLDQAHAREMQDRSAFVAAQSQGADQAHQAGMAQQAQQAAADQQAAAAAQPTEVDA